MQGFLAIVLTDLEWKGKSGFKNKQEKEKRGREKAQKKGGKNERYSSPVESIYCKGYYYPV